ncbi:MAG: hypothetical protein FJ288_17280 [Planctomycetes bacterium]|nr:hypothetical protein [Planctomycetota bacterium]
MIRYRDTGAPDSEVCPGQWFDENIVAGARSFRGQFGFFRFGAIRKYGEVLHGLAASGRTVNLVIGSNIADPLTTQDARDILRLLADGSHAHLTVIALGNALFHPKVAHIVRSDGAARAFVGSANMTELAFGVHVEAWVEIESGLAAADQALNDIATAIDRWHSVTGNGVYQVRTDAHIESLLSQGIIIDATARRATKAAPAAAGGTARPRGRGTRRARWRAPVPARRPKAEGEAETALMPATFEEAGAATGQIVLRWSKKLSRSDVNKNAQNIRNLMSLTKARLIDDLDFFRNVFFSDAAWRRTTISGHAAEIADVELNVKVPSKRTRLLTLQVVHAPHREAGQHNYHTSIRWGPLAGELRNARGDGYTGFWAVLEKHDTGEYSLTVAADEPSRRFIG